MGHTSRTQHHLEDAAAAAAIDLISGSRNPTLVVDAIDMAGAVAAVNLARVCSMRLDHAAQSYLAPLQDAGFLATTPGEASLRADFVLWVGPTHQLIETDDAARRLFDDPKIVAKEDPKPRRHLCVANSSDDPPKPDLTRLNLANRNLTETLGLLRASAKSQPIAIDAASLDAINSTVADLKAAKYGVAVFASGQLSFLEQSNLMGLIDDLSSETRWTMLPTGTPAGHAELTRMSLALTGLSMPLAFQNNRARHDAHLYGAKECLSRGETDLVIWVSSSQYTIPPAFLSAPNTVAITAHASAPTGVGAHLRIGIAGVDHAAILEPVELASAVAVTPPQSNSALPTAAGVLNMLAENFESQPEVAA